MEPNELKYWVAFSRSTHVGPVSFQRMEQHFGSLENAWHAGLNELKAAGVDKRAAQEKLGVRAITWNDDEYPLRLEEIYDKPAVLFVRGELLPEDERSVAVVGTRKASPYGREVAYQLTHDLAMSGVVIVSGLARGIDGIAHRSALDAGKRTIAVLGNGVDVSYPREHDKLAAEIMESGALVSEHPLGRDHTPRTSREATAS